MATVSRRNASHSVVATVGVSGVVGIAIFQCDVVVFFVYRQRELTLAVGYPDTQLRANQRAEHHSIALLDVQTDERRFELVAIVVQHTRFHSVFGGNQTQLDHQLATVANAQREGILACIEVVQSAFCSLVVEECACPTLSRAEYVRVRETTAEYDHIHVLQRLTTTY